MIEDGFIQDVSFPKRLKDKRQKVHYLTDDMEKDLLDNLYSKQNPNTWMAADIIKCLIDLGCRVNELLNLEKRFVDFDNNQINFNERKNEQAVAVPMTNRVQKIMKKCFYYSARPTEKPLVNVVWVQDNGAAIGQMTTIDMIFEPIEEYVTIPEEVRLEVIRKYEDKLKPYLK